MHPLYYTCITWLTAKIYCLTVPCRTDLGNVIFVSTTEGSSSMETLKHHSVFTSGWYGSIALDAKTMIPLYLMQARTKQHPHLHLLALKTPPPLPPTPLYLFILILNFISHASKAQPWREEEKKAPPHPPLPGTSLV